MYYCSEAVKYLPELDDLISFEKHAGTGSGSGSGGLDLDGGSSNKEGAGLHEECLHEECVRAGKNLDEVISTLIKNFDAGSDYFKVLVNVFQNVLLAEDTNDDLRTSS
jgi:hypothetical protein